MRKTYGGGWNWKIEIGRTAGTLPYAAVRDDVVRILKEYQQVGIAPPTLAELSQKKIEADAARGWIVTPSQVKRAYNEAAQKLKRRGRPPKSAPKADK
jgi:hypothetical protein